MSDASIDTRQVGRHVFLFSKRNGQDGPPTIIARPVDISQDLPREFLRYLRTLFDVLDENGNGLVKLADIESRWKTKQSSNALSEGVIESLRKVTPKNGLLSFERLCTGMKLALKAQPQTGKNGYGQTNKPSSSFPKLDSSAKDWTSDSSEDSSASSERREKVQMIKKLREWKEESPNNNRRSQNLTSNNIGGSESGSGSNSPSSTGGSPARKSNPTTRVYFVGKEGQGDVTTNGHSKPTRPLETNKHGKEARVQELEEEHSLLQSGLQVIEKARKWYFKRITAIQEEKLHLQNEDQHSLEQFQYELLLLKTRRKELGLDEESFKEHKYHIQEVNECLTRIVEGKPPEKAHQNGSTEADEERRQLQEEVERLKKEVFEKNSKISQLESEKSALIRDLFNNKATTGNNGFIVSKRSDNKF